MSSRGGTINVIQMYLITACMLAILHTVYSHDSCPHGQVDRSREGIKICCHPAVCKPNQQFLLCEENHGFDNCVNCTKGYGHKDLIDTSQWKRVVDLCMELEDCSEYSDQHLENDECVCDRTKGYFGLDRNRCSVDENNRCRKAGHQLTLTGECEMCKDGYFKMKEDYSLCVEKTNCEPDLEIDDPGSHIKDRACGKKISHSPDAIIRNVSFGVISDSSSRNTTERGKLNEHGGLSNTNITKDFNGTNEEKADFEPEVPVHKNAENGNTIIAFVCAALAVLVVFMGVWILNGCLHRLTVKKGTNRTGSDEHHSVSYNCICFQVHNDDSRNTNITARNVNAGNGNRIVIGAGDLSSGENSPSSDQVTLNSDSGPLDDSEIPDHDEALSLLEDSAVNQDVDKTADCEDTLLKQTQSSEV